MRSVKRLAQGDDAIRHSFQIPDEDCFGLTINYQIMIRAEHRSTILYEIISLAGAGSYGELSLRAQRRNLLTLLRSPRGCRVGLRPPRNDISAVEDSENYSLSSKILSISSMIAFILATTARYGPGCARSTPAFDSRT